MKIKILLQTQVANNNYKKINSQKKKKDKNEKEKVKEIKKEK